MAISRYNNLVEFINATSGYRKTFKARYGEQGIRQTGVNTLSYPTQEIYDQIETAAVTWQVGDRFYKLASKFNKKPTEQHVQLGETVLVPLFLDELLSIIGL